MAWFKNNYVTKKGQLQKKVLQDQKNKVVDISLDPSKATLPYLHDNNRIGTITTGTLRVDETKNND